MTIQVGSKHQFVVLATTKMKKQNKPASLHHKSDQEGVSSCCQGCYQSDILYEPNLKKTAPAKLSVVYKSLNVYKSNVKKMNRHTVKTYARK